MVQFAFVFGSKWRLLDANRRRKSTTLIPSLVKIITEDTITTQFHWWKEERSLLVTRWEDMSATDLALPQSLLVYFSSLQSRYAVSAPSRLTRKGLLAVYGYKRFFLARGGNTFSAEGRTHERRNREKNLWSGAQRLTLIFFGSQIERLQW